MGNASAALARYKKPSRMRFSTGFILYLSSETKNVYRDPAGLRSYLSILLRCEHFSPINSPAIF